MTALEHYDTFHESYLRHCPDDILQSSKPGNALPMLKKIVDITNMQNKFVLDAGSGLGLPAFFFAQNFNNEVTGINICQKQLDHAKFMYGDSVTFKKHSFDNLGKLSGVFELALFLETIGHSQDLTKLFKTLHNKTLEVFIKHVLPVDEGKTSVSEDLYGYKSYTFEKIVTEAIGAGFKLKEFGTLPFTPEKNVAFAREIGSPLIDVECKYIYVTRGN